MLDMGFIHDIKKILALLPKKRQNLLFSATFSKEIRHLAKAMINDPVEISVTPINTTVDSVEHFLYTVDQKQKTKALIKLIKTEKWKQAIVFSRTKHGANRIAKNLEQKGISAAAIHGNKVKCQNEGVKPVLKMALLKFWLRQILQREELILISSQVVNFDLPHVAEDYIHRIGAQEGRIDR